MELGQDSPLARAPGAHDLDGPEVVGELAASGGHHEVAQPGVEEQQRAKRTHGGGEDYEDDADRGDNADGKELLF